MIKEIACSQSTKPERAISCPAQVARVSGLQAEVSVTLVNPTVQSDSTQASVSTDGGTLSGAIVCQAPRQHDAKSARRPNPPRG